MGPPSDNAHRAVRDADGRLADLPPAARLPAAAPARCSLLGVLGMVDLCRHRCGLGRVRAASSSTAPSSTRTRAWSGWCQLRWSGCSCCAASAISCRPTARDSSAGTSSRRCARRSSTATCICRSAFFDSNASGVLLSRLTYNTEQVAQATTDSITVFIRDTLTIVGLDRLPVLPEPAADAVQPDRRPADRGPDPPHQPCCSAATAARIQDSMGDVTRVAKEAIEAPRVVRVFNAQDYQAQVFDTVIEHNRRSHMKMMRTQGRSAIRSCRSSRRSASPACCTWRRVDAIAGQDDGRRVHLVHRRADADHGAAAHDSSTSPGRCSRASPRRRASSRCSTAPRSRRAADDAIERARGDIEYRDVRFRYPAGEDEVLRGVSFALAAG